MVMRLNEAIPVDLEGTQKIGDPICDPCVLPVFACGLVQETSSRKLRENTST
jgi:hypothetical protein